MRRRLTRGAPIVFKEEEEEEEEVDEDEEEEEEKERDVSVNEDPVARGRETRLASSGGTEEEDEKEEEEAPETGENKACSRGIKEEWMATPAVDVG